MVRAANKSDASLVELEDALMVHLVESLAVQKEQLWVGHIGPKAHVL